MNEKNDISEPPGSSDESLRVKRRFRFRRANEITGTFVLIVIAALIAAVLWTGHSQRWFKSRVALRIALPAAGAAGIRQGSEVYFLGTLVGSVSDLVVDATGRMAAEVNIRRDFFRFVRADSSAAVKMKFGVAGDSYFEITRGQGDPLPEKNATIVCKEQFQSALEAAVEQIRAQTTALLAKASAGLETWTVLGTNLIATQGRLEELAGRLNNIASGIEQGKGTAGKLITDTALADEAQNLLVQANEMMSALKSTETNLNVAVGNLRNGTERLPEITDAVAGEMKDLPGLVRQTQTSMREVERLVEAMQRNWLLRRYVNATNPPPSHPQPEITTPETRPVRNFRSPRNSTK